MRFKPTCILMLMVLTLANAAYAKTGSSRERVITEVTRYGGKVEFDEARKDKPIIKIDPVKGFDGGSISMLTVKIG
ncbi:MAG TPA: hypothetical protein VEM96_21220 [Pyrinomonadaceae bacterium]|nr:hypothetical protein [Pyrinomonadaceae bacterium]